MTDFAKAAALKIIEDLSDRRGIRQALEDCDAQDRIEVTDTIAQIVRDSTYQWIDKPTGPGFWFYRRGEHIDTCRVYQLDLDHWDSVPHNVDGWAGPLIPPKDTQVSDKEKP